MNYSTSSLPLDKSVLNAFYDNIISDKKYVQLEMLLYNMLLWQSIQVAIQYGCMRLKDMRTPINVCMQRKRKKQ